MSEPDTNEDINAAQGSLNGEPGDEEDTHCSKSNELESNREIKIAQTSLLEVLDEEEEEEEEGEEAKPKTSESESNQDIDTAQGSILEVLVEEHKVEGGKDDSNSAQVQPEQQATKETASQKKLRKLKTYLDCGTSCTTESLKSLIANSPRRLKNAPHLEDGSEVEEGHGENKDIEEEEGLDEPMPFSDLSDPSRNIWIVTTASLPWRTGTAVNPFLRALYLVKRRLNLGLYDEEEKTYPSGDKVNNGCKAKEDKKVGKVTLVIPWLVDKAHSDKLFGPDIVTETGDAGKQQQIDWIKKYADEKCGMAEEMKFLNILFYNAAYWKAFGSIFASEDICDLVPYEEADVAILEEPEHLNWFRMPSTKKKLPKADDDSKDGYSGPTPVCGKIQVRIPQALRRAYAEEEVDKNISEEIDNENNKLDRNDVKSVVVGDEDEDEEKQSELGWARKFNFVVGVIHTNYSAYMKQYGLGSSIIGAPALSAISTMVVRAYCHKVVRLSAVIPSYAKWKEVTCNVHGVRGDFLGEGTESKQNEAKTEADDQSAQIYFIGKIIWPKGFDHMLKVQELYRNSNVDREYFPIDVYGAGPDETAICRAFHGRLQNSPSRNDRKTENDDILLSDSSDAVFSEKFSIKKQLFNLVHSKEEDVPQAIDEAKSYINMGFEVVAPPESIDSNYQGVVVMERKVLVSDKEEEVVDPFSILTDVSVDVATTGIATKEAVVNLADTAIKSSIAVAFSQEHESHGSDNDEDDNDLKENPSFIFDPPKSLFELRRNPIPARFLGVKDHALLRHSAHKIFFNPSLTEVLCTTTAEALAMGKFVVIPEHPSNEFFLQFPNCLAYKNLHDCVEKIKWALRNEPEPLSESHAHIFTWEAATDRLIQSSLISRREANERDTGGRDKTDLRMAWLHSQGGKQGRFIKTLFSKNEKVQQDEEGSK